MDLAAIRRLTEKELKDVAGGVRRCQKA